MNTYPVDLWSARLRVLFWIAGIGFGALLCFTNRYYVNGDAMAYVEMGEALRTGCWWALANSTYSPGYPVLLGLGQILLNTEPLNEIVILKVVNLVCLIAAMAACDGLLVSVRKELGNRTTESRGSLPLPVIAALTYSMFLVASLSWVRPRLMNPDMLVLAVVLGGLLIILWIRSNPETFFGYALLGCTLGLGYLVKSFLFVFSPVFFLLAGMASVSMKKAIPRVMVSIVALLIVASPLIGSLSYRLGKLSYGELGRHAYSVWIAGKGDPIHPPPLLNETPEVRLYPFSVPCTRPSGFDMCFWSQGIVPKLDVKAQAKVFSMNVVEIFWQTPWLLLVLAWAAFEWKRGCLKLGSLTPLSFPLTLIIPAVLGTAFYCLLYMEQRYLAPFIFPGFVGFIAGLQYRSEDTGKRSISTKLALAITLILVALVLTSVVDQSMRGLRSTDTKRSYRDAFEEQLAVKDFLALNGIRAGDEVAIVGDQPLYWARMAKTTIVAEIPHAVQFLDCTKGERGQAIQSLRDVGIKALLAKGSEWSNLDKEGWSPVPRTQGYYMLTITGDRAFPTGHR